MTETHPALKSGKELIQAIENENWQSITAIASARDELILNNTDLTASTMRELLAQNQTIQTVLHDQKRSLLDRSAKLGQRKDANRAYESNRV